MDHDHGLLIIFQDGSELRLDMVRKVEITGPNTITTMTFGNGPVMHRRIKSFRYEVDFEDLLRGL